MIQIKRSYTGKVIKEVDATSLVNADLRGADLWCADLRGSDLRGVDLQAAGLCGANLQGANLEGANLEGVNLRGVDLGGADLGGANLRGADLENADIRWVFGDGKRIITIDDYYRIVIMLEYGVMAIGCKQHSITEWMNFSDKEIDKMHAGALQWWKVWKPRIQQLIVD
jgi:uncharacterized protein YjbI with pentapeptide repeats